MEEGDETRRKRTKMKKRKEEKGWRNEGGERRRKRTKMKRRREEEE